MRPGPTIAALLALALAAVGGCGRGGGPAVARAPSPAATAADEQGPLTAADVQMFLAVREKALQRLEEALDAVEARGGDVLSQVQEVTVAERDATRALGARWRRFTWVQDQIGRLLTSQRQHDDQRLLGTELARARDDLKAQLAVARDPAGRQFLEAQLRALTGQIDKLEHDRLVPAPEAAELRELESARAEIATLQGRQDRVQHRLQELLQRANPGGAVTPSAAPAR